MPAFSFGLKCLSHLNDKAAANKIFTLILFISGMNVGYCNSQIVLKAVTTDWLANYLGIIPGELHIDQYYEAGKNVSEVTDDSLSTPGELILIKNWH